MNKVTVTGGKMRKALLAILLSMSVTMLFGTAALAFHDGGVAYCAGCHTMHNSENGVPIDPAHPLGNAYLLKYDTPSDLCLSCHATSRGAVFSTDPLNPAIRPGGNFCFLLEDNLNDGHNGHLNPIPGGRGGHNIVAPAYGVAADEILSHSPGGDFPSAILGCTSCHAPHGNANFRLLNGIGSIQDDLYTFVNPAPQATAISYNTTETNSAHTAYKSGWAEWCANCHGDFHSLENPSSLIHPSGEVMGEGNTYIHYNLYNGTEDPTGGSQATAFLALVPFEDPSMTTSSTAGPSATSKVTCISCHRAHASSAINSGRWDFQVTLMDEDGVESGSFAIPSPYPSPEQRSLCNKCHVKDAE
jgi:cytochrome c553